MNIERVEKTYLPLGKAVLNLVSGVGVGRIVGGVATLAGPQATTFGRVAVYIAQLGITGAVCVPVNANNEAAIDGVFAVVKGFTTNESTQT